MKWILVVLITANNAENVTQIGPFYTHDQCETAERFVKQHSKISAMCINSDHNG